MSLTKKLLSKQAVHSFGAFGGNWEEQTKGDISDQTEVVFTIDPDCARVLLFADSDCRIRFNSTSTNDQITANSPPLIRANVPLELSIPQGHSVGDKTIYCHVKQAISQSSRTCYCVEM